MTHAAARNDPRPNRFLVGALALLALALLLLAAWSRFLVRSKQASRVRDAGWLPAADERAGALGELLRGR